jgi:hypothetical protein
MSSYKLTAKRKSTGEVREFFALDDFYGSHQYGYKDGEGTTYDQKGFDKQFEVVSSPTLKV